MISFLGIEPVVRSIPVYVDGLTAELIAEELCRLDSRCGLPCLSAGIQFVKSPDHLLSTHRYLLAEHAPIRGLEIFAAEMLDRILIRILG